MTNDELLMKHALPKLLHSSFVIRHCLGYYIYFDHCMNPQYHGAIKSADLKAWQDISPMPAFPKGTRHETVLSVPGKIVEQIRKYQKQSQIPI
jgi:hypothetical protein